MIATVLTSVLATLMGVGLLAIFRSRWLYLIVPKLYLNTPLSNGHVVSLTLTNAGVLAEEEIKVRLKTTCRYEFLAGSDTTLKFENNTLSLPRLARGQSVNALLLVEGKTFEHSDIEAVESKLTSGKVVQNKEQVSAPWHHILIWPILIAVLLVPFSVGMFVGKLTGSDAIDFARKALLEPFAPSKQLAGYQVDLVERHASIAGELANATADGRVTLTLVEILRRGDILIVTGEVSNQMRGTLVVDITSETSAGNRGQIEFEDYRVENMYIQSGSKKLFRVQAYLPEEVNPKVLVLDYSLRYKRDSNSIEQSVTFR